jgi:hypothetical protein
MPIDESAFVAGLQLGHDFFGPGLVFGKLHAAGPHSFAAGPSGLLGGIGHGQHHSHHPPTSLVSGKEFVDETKKSFGVGHEQALAENKADIKAANKAEAKMAKEKYGPCACLFEGTY